MKTFSAATALAMTMNTADAGECKPVKVIMTRASGSPAMFDATNSTWSTKYGLSTVNTGSLQCSLKYVITETIDAESGYSDNCERKNGVSFIHFYEFTICNPDEALWWFNPTRPGGFGGDSAEYNYGEFGQYLTMDGGQCHDGEAEGDGEYCNSLHGQGTSPDLGPFVGWQDNSADTRNPTDNCYWYSLPGECPLYTWNEKKEECSAAELSGQCPKGKVPDGETCTWSYTMLGQVSIDELAGITEIANQETGENFKDNIEYCKAGNKEFLRDPSSFKFEEGLDFWKDPLDKEANAARIVTLLEVYAAGENNIAIPAASNPRCYESVPGCFVNGEETCTRDSDQLCVPCDDVEGGCTGEVTIARAFDTTALKEPLEQSEESGFKGKSGNGPDIGGANTIMTSAGAIVSSLIVALW